MIDISARNRLQGTITRIELDGVTAEVTVDVGGGNAIVSVITKGSVERMGLKEGDKVLAVVKSTDVMIGKD